MKSWSTSARRMVRSRKMSRKSLRAMMKLRRKADHRPVPGDVKQDRDGEPDEDAVFSSARGEGRDDRRDRVKAQRRDDDERTRGDAVAREEFGAEPDEVEAHEGEEESQFFSEEEPGADESADDEWRAHVGGASVVCDAGDGLGDLFQGGDAEDEHPDRDLER